MKTDDELNALFAEHYEGWKRCNCRECAGDNQPMWIPHDIDDPSSKNWCRAHWNPPSYTTDANAVLPWLEKQGAWSLTYALPPICKREVAYGVYVEPGRMGEADTFPRAAVIALLRARGMEV